MGFNVPCLPSLAVYPRTGLVIKLTVEARAESVPRLQAVPPPPEQGRSSYSTTLKRLEIHEKFTNPADQTHQ